MSKVSISGDQNGTGNFTIKAPNSNSDRTLNLPDEAGTVLTSASTLGVNQLPNQLSVDGSASNGSISLDGNGNLKIPNQPLFFVSKNSNQNILTTSTTIIFDNLEINRNGNFDSASSKFFAPVDGTYLFNISVSVRSDGATARYIAVRPYKNSTVFEGGLHSQLEHMSTSTYSVISGSYCANLSQGDQFYFQIDAANTGLSVYEGGTSFFGLLIG